jgi:cytochrome c biogenesis protein CcmG, thiol:disulfide interchange protein DsbE
MSASRPGSGGVAPALGRRLGWLTAGCGLLLALCTLTPALAAPAVGKTAPDFEVAGVGTSKVDLAHLKGKVVYLDFWASWCPACQQAFPWLNTMQERYGARGLQVVGLSVEVKREEADAFLVDHPAGFLVGFDVANKVPRIYNVRGMPTSLLIGADGRIRLIHDGYTPADGAVLEKAIVEALDAR